MSLDDIIDELKKDCLIDEINLKESALMLPAKKAKWVARLILQKNKLNDLEKKKKLEVNKFVERKKEEAISPVSINVLKSLAEKECSIMDIDSQIESTKNTIDFLERIEKIMSSLSFDIGNIIKIVQLETT
jgi:uncharacterized protein (UPF0264 family)